MQWSNSKTEHSLDILGPIKSSFESDPYDADAPIVTAVFSHWCDAANGKWAPAWRDIDIMILPPPLLPYLWSQMWHRTVISFIAIGGGAIRRIMARIILESG